MNDLEKEVLHLIGENVDAPDVFTDNDIGILPIRDSLNDAIEEISLVTGGTKRTFFLLARANQSFYRITGKTDRLAWITDAWLFDQKRRLEATSVAKLKSFNPRWMLNTGPPFSYFQIGWDVVGIWPQPTAGVVVQLDCVVAPKRYDTDGSPIRLREEWKRAAVHYAVSEYWASRGDAKSASSHFQKYLELVGMASLYPYTADKQWQMQTDKRPWPKNTG